jgi:hypothetical protein
MSEIRRTEPVEAFEAPSSEPLISLSDVLAGVGWLAYHGARLTVEGAKLAYQGGSALAKSIRESRDRALTLPEIDAIVESAPSNREAIERLAGTRALDLPKSTVARWQSEFSVLDPSDKEGLRSAMHRLVGERQTRLQSEISTLAAESCRELGFQASTLRPEHGVLVARKGRETLTVVTERRKDGGIALHFDADGFHGDACVKTLNALHRKLEERGVRFHVSSRRRKDEHRAIDAGRLGSGQRLRHR